MNDYEFEAELFKLLDIVGYEEDEDEKVEEYDDGWTDPIESLRKRA